MDLKIFYQKLRQIEASIAEAHVVVVSHETPDGGRAGVRTEVPRAVAAKMIAEGRARLAQADEAKEFHDQKAEAKRLADQSAAANRMHVTVVTDTDLRTLKSSSRSSKKQE